MEREIPESPGPGDVSVGIVISEQFLVDTSPNVVWDLHMTISKKIII